MGTELEAPTIPAPSYPSDANRIERLLQKLGTSTEAIDVAWQEPSDQTTDQPASVGKVDQ